MLKEKYLKDFDLVNQDKPKGKKILKKFKEELKIIFDLYQRIQTLGYFPSELTESQIYQSTHFYSKISDIHQKLSNDYTLNIYKNVYDDIFIYLSKIKPVQNEYQIKEEEEIIFLLDQNYKINQDLNSISYISLNIHDYYVWMKKEEVSYSINFVSPQSQHTRFIEKGQIKKIKYNKSLIDLNKILYYSYSSDNKDFQHLRFNDNDIEELIVVDKCINERTDFFKLSHKLDGFRIDYELSSDKIIIDLSKENNEEEIFEYLYSIESTININEKIDDFQKNNYQKDKYRDVSALADLLMLELDITINPEEVKFIKYLFDNIPNVYDFIKESYLEKDFKPIEIISNYKKNINIQHSSIHELNLK